MKALSICKQCKQAIKENPFKFGKGLFCCPEHAAAFYETIKDNPSKLRLSGITDEELIKIQGLQTKVEQVEEDVFDNTAPVEEKVESQPTQPVVETTTSGLLNTNEDYLMPVYNLMGEITNGMTKTSEGLRALKERTKDVDLITMYYLLYDKYDGLINVFTKCTAYNSYGAMAYMIAVVKRMLENYKPAYVSPSKLVDDINTNYYHPQDENYKLVNTRIPFNALFGNSNEEDDLI